MRERSLRPAGRRGSIALLYTMMLFALVPLVGLAVDATLLYITQGQLQVAVDGAANGAVRLVGSNANETEISKEFVKANMPNGYWFSRNLTVTNASVSSGSTANVANVSAQVTVPTLFMRWFGQTASTITASGTAMVWNIQPCTLSYPSGSAPSLTSVVFNEAIDLQGWGPTFVLPHGKIIAWYNDEHALTLGIYKVYVTNSTGATTTTDYSSSFTFFSGNLGAGNSTSPLPVGTTILSGDQAGTDTAAWTSAYNYQNGRPIWPAIFVTDITANSTANSGDWQQGGTAAVPPNAIYGTWKGAVRCVNYSSTAVGCPAGASGPGPGGGGPGGGGPGSGSGVASGGHPGITFAEDADPPANCSGGGTGYTCNGVPDTPTGGWTQNQGWSSELVWYIDSLGLLPGHSYRLQVMLHDGDQHQNGGDTGEGCMVAKY
jgi:Flp pilus assembly protein TadG